MKYIYDKYGSIKVAWLPELNGGGNDFGLDYIAVVSKLFGRVGHVHEFCAGPGYIGFALLSAGLCDRLTLSDINPKAVKAARHTIRLNGLEDRVRVYLANGLRGIPARQAWDLVVSNPPHFKSGTNKRRNLITEDPGWSLHRDFYRKIHKYLKPSGSVLLQENYEGSQERDFIPFLKAGKLDYLGSYNFMRPNGTRDKFYYIWAKRQDPRLIWRAPGEKGRVWRSAIDTA